MASVGEEDKTVQVCATLSDVPAGGNDIPISITLATSDSSPGIEVYHGTSRAYLFYYSFI